MMMRMHFVLSLGLAAGLLRVVDDTPSVHAIAEPPADVSPDEYEQVMVALLLDADSVVTVDTDLLNGLLMNDDAHRRLAVKCFGSPRAVGQFSYTAGILSQPGAGRLAAQPTVCQLTVWVSTEVGSKASAGRCARLLVEEIQGILDALYERVHLSLRADVEQAQAEVARSQEALTALLNHRLEFITNRGRPDPPREAVVERMAALEERLADLETDRRALDARRQAIEEAVARTAAAAKDRIAADAALKELRTVVKLKEAALQRLADLKEKALVSEHETSTVLEDLSLARARLAEREYVVAQDAGGGAMARYNEQLADVTIALSETSVRYQQLREQRAELPDLLAKADAYEREIAVLLPVVRNTLEGALRRAADAERRLREARPPRLTVLGELPPDAEKKDE